MREVDRWWVEGRLGYAYAMHARHLSPHGLHEWVSRSTNPCDLTPHERIADGCVLRTRALRVAQDPDMIEAIWLVPIAENQERKNALVTELGCKLSRQIRGDPHQLADAIRRYCNLSPRHEDAWWARHARQRTSRATICRRGKEARELLDSWHAQELRRIYPVVDSSEIAV